MSNFTRHQVVNAREAQSTLPPCTDLHRPVGACTDKSVRAEHDRNVVYTASVSVSASASDTDSGTEISERSEISDTRVAVRRRREDLPPPCREFLERYPATPRTELRLVAKRWGRSSLATSRRCSICSTTGSSSDRRQTEVRYIPGAQVWLGREWPERKHPPRGVIGGGERESESTRVLREFLTQAKETEERNEHERSKRDHHGPGASDRAEVGPSTFGVVVESLGQKRRVP